MQNTFAKISAVVISPVFNEAELVPTFVYAVEDSLSDIDLKLILVDDGSEDNIRDVFKNLQMPKYNSSRELVCLSRNFGHASAIFAGLNFIKDRYDVFVVMDSDMQDQPRDIKLLISEVLRGADCAYAVRKPNAESVVRNVATHIFYAIQRSVSSLKIPSYAGNFSAFNTKFKDTLLTFSESEIFFPGLRSYIGFKQVAVFVERGVREGGVSKMSLRRLLSLAYVGLIGFSSAPMRLIFILGLLNMTIFFITFLVLFFLSLFKLITFDSKVLILLCVLLANGMQTLFIGILGEYLGKVFTESKRRPSWVINEVVNYTST